MFGLFRKKGEASKAETTPSHHTAQGAGTAEVLYQIELPNGLTVRLYDWMVVHRRNLVATDRHGVEVWRADPGGPPDSADCFTTVEWNGVSLIAYTFSCFEVSVDPGTGTVTVLRFTK